MKSFLNDDFFLTTPTARRLYHEVAAPLPIIDYHNHLPPAEVAENRAFADIFEAWLEGDHYKWRAMRADGVEERFITGNASPEEKFRAWAATVPRTIGNPLYHWTHLELRRYFGITELLSPSTADAIWEQTKRALQAEDFRARALLGAMNVDVICTTDDPADDLAHHAAYARDKDALKGASPRMFPAFRPDKSHKMENLEAWNAYINTLGETAGVDIRGWDDLREALIMRHAEFHSRGCRVSDHGIDFPVNTAWDDDSADRIFRKARSGEAPTTEDIHLIRTAVMETCARMDAAAGWVMQIHMGALRSVNSRRYAELGPDTGFDVIGDWRVAGNLAGFLDRLDRDGELPKMILYSVNAADNDVIAAMIGAFQGGTPGKMQFGSGWWHHDQKNGMEKQMTSLANLGLLSHFVGMLTDSRSFLSFPRHEYFRRILCNLVGGWVEAGEAPDDRGIIDGLIVDICYRNAQSYFAFDDGNPAD